LRIAEEEHLLLVTMHHIVSDGWSVGVMIRELVTLYNTYRAGLPIHLAPLDIQYADFAIWEQNWLSGRTLEREVGYWTRQLDGVVPLALPLDRPHPGVNLWRGKQHRFTLDAELTRALEGLGRAHGATLFMSLLATFHILLHQYSQQDDICVTTSIANRTRSEIEPLIGFFVNRLILRAKIDPQYTFSSFLEQVRGTTLEGYAHQEVPYDRVVTALPIDFGPGRTPLCQAFFVLQNMSTPPFSLDGLVAEVTAGELDASKFELSLIMEEEAGTLLGALEYQTALFDDDAIGGMARHFERLVRAITRDPREALSRLPHPEFCRP
jgi:hypothetical protein